ncbi:MAG: hypothetical protein KDD89_13200, partial [Anaerolineales bacterium]|nr:hypothetical protein [Anaerolineales bacterium]
MTDSLLYRANRIPERNRRQFLALLDLPLRPAAAAQGLVTFSNPRGSLTVHTLPDALTVSAGSIPFRTQDGLDVLPLEAMAYYKQTVDEQTLGTQKTAYEEVYASLLEPGDKLTYYETVPLAAPVNGAVYPEVDLDRITNKSLWLALLARSAEEVEDTRKLIANKTLTLGILPVLASDNVALTKVMYPAGTEVAALSRLVYEMPKVGDSLLPDDPRQRVPQYEQLPNVPSGDLLAEPGVVEIRLPDVAGLRLWQNMEPAEAGTADFPPVIEDTETAVRLITWLRIRLQSAAVTAQDAPQLRGRLSWVGINAARVTQRVRVFAENLGRGSGEPDQSVTLINTPVIPDSVTLTVGGETWTEVNDLLAAAPEVPLTLLPGSRTAPPQRRQNDSRVFAVDYESGTIRCGDGLRGMRWPRNAILRATYDYGGGRQGNVGIGAITKATTLPNGVKATNPIRTWGGDEAETVAAAEKRIPAYLQHRDRLVSDADFGEIIEQTPGVEIGRHNVLSLVHPNITDADAPGVVTIVVIPAHDPLHPNAPQP